MTAREFINEWYDSSKNYFEAHTSGSTGTPKTIRISRRDALISAHATNSFFFLGTDSRFVCPMNFNYIGARMMAIRAIECGGKLIDVEPSNRFDFDGRADLLAIVPSQVPRLLDGDMSPERIHNVIIGGAPLDAEIAARIADAGYNAYVTYGMTETCSHIALAHVRNYYKSTPVYKALPGVTFSTDERDCLIINMAGRDCHTVVTNDCVSLLSPTSFIWLCRHDNIINSGAVKIIPSDVEKATLKAFEILGISCLGVVCVSRPDRQLGEAAVCFVKTSAIPGGALMHRLLEEARRNSVAPYAWPRNIIPLVKFPLTQGDKIDFVALREMARTMCN